MRYLFWRKVHCSFLWQIIVLTNHQVQQFANLGHILLKLFFSMPNRRRFALSSDTLFMLEMLVWLSIDQHDFVDHHYFTQRLKKHRKTMTAADVFLLNKILHKVIAIRFESEHLYSGAISQLS